MVDAGTGGPRDPERLGQTLARWLEARWPRAAGLEIGDLVTPRLTGFSNETVIFRAAWREDGRPREDRFVLRIEPSEPMIYPQQTATPLPSVEVQYRAMRAVAAQSDVPLAPLVGYESSPTLLGGPFFVMGYVDGRVPSDVPLYTHEGFLVDEATPADRRRLVESGLEALARLHRIDWRKADLGWLVPQGRAPGLGWQLELHGEYARRELAGREHPILQQAFGWLEAHRPAEGEIGLSWGDARLGNMIFAGFECAAVTDWEAIALGPPELDLGWWLMFDRFAHESGGAARLPGMPTRDEQRACYESLSGRRVADSHYFEVLAAMRFAAVMIRNGDRLTRAGRMPPEMRFAIHNPGAQVLADLLEVPYRWTDRPE